jgi:hypothetical protein
MLNSQGLCGNGALIGVGNGQYARALLDAWDGIRLYLIDPYETGDSARLQEQAVIQCKPYAQRYRFIRLHHDKAVKLFANGELDFVYIDAVSHDLTAWLGKVKHGGLIAGSGYAGEAKQSVDALVKANGLQLRLTKEATPSWYAWKV